MSFVLRAAQQYPELKADRTYSVLITDLQTIEGELQQLIPANNAHSRRHNTNLHSFPITHFTISRKRYPELVYDDVFVDAQATVRPEALAPL